jgi:hypothetical protein
MLRCVLHALKSNWGVLRFRVPSGHLLTAGSGTLTLATAERHAQDGLEMVSFTVPMRHSVAQPRCLTLFSAYRQEVSTSANRFTSRRPLREHPCY